MGINFKEVFPSYSGGEKLKELESDRKKLENRKSKETNSIDVLQEELKIKESEINLVLEAVQFFICFEWDFDPISTNNSKGNNTYIFIIQQLEKERNDRDVEIESMESQLNEVSNLLIILREKKRD